MIVTDVKTERTLSSGSDVQAPVSPSLAPETDHVSRKMVCALMMMMMMMMMIRVRESNYYRIYSRISRQFLAEF